MAREIKFRAWHPINKEMVYPTLGQNFGFGAYTNSHILRDFSPENIMQFTGLKDKNGKEIYEGDIVMEKYLDFVDEEVSLDRITKERISIVEYRHHGFWVKDESFGWEGESLWNWNLIEVIGNIYENSELLNNEYKGNDAGADVG